MTIGAWEQMLPLINFNSHAHVERDMKADKGMTCGFDFNSHAHVERDPCKYYKPDEVRNFNSHAHVERDSQN